MKPEQPTTQLPKMKFLNICATVGFTPAGLAHMAQVSKWDVYAMLDGQPVERAQAQAVLNTLNQFNPLKGTIAYDLENVAIALKEDIDEQPEDASIWL